jgi:GNAT superfamily N-acetyltransferase
VEEHQTHREILEAIPSRRFLASLADAGQVVACGLGVLETGYLGLFDLITDPHQRNRGYGTKLLTSLLRWAQENGASHAYLQVVGKNAPARHLYAKLGFEEAYPYWYRVAGT